MNEHDFLNLTKQFSAYGIESLVTEAKGHARQAKLDKSHHEMFMENLNITEAAFKRKLARLEKENAEYQSNLNRNDSPTIPARLKEIIIHGPLANDVRAFLLGIAEHGQAGQVYADAFDVSNGAKFSCAAVSVGTYFDKSVERISQIISYTLEVEGSSATKSLLLWRSKGRWMEAEIK